MITTTASLAALDTAALALLVQTADVTAGAAAAREIDARAAALTERYHRRFAGTVREYVVTDDSGAVIGTATRTARGAFDVAPADSTARVPFDSLAAARAWLRDLAYLAR